MQNLKQRLGILTGFTATLMILGATAANAATDPVTDGFSTAQDKVTQYGGAMILLVLVGLGIALGIKYLAKGFRKA